MGRTAGCVDNPPPVYPTHQKEEFQYAFVHAIAACAGCAVERYKREGDDKADVMIRSDLTTGAIEHPRIEIQMKCSETIAIKGASFQFEIPVDLYRAMRSLRRSIPLFLVILHVPLAVPDWMQQKRQMAHLRHRAYFLNLRGAADTPNTTTITVTVPTKNVFDAKSLARIMQRASEAEFDPKIVTPVSK